MFTVLDQRRAVLTDSGFDFVGHRKMSLFERLVVLHENVDIVDMNEGIAERTGNIFIDHGDHMLGALDGGQRSIDRSTQRHVTVRIRFRHLDHRHITGQYAAAVKFLRFAQENRNVIGVTGLRHLAHVAANEKRIELEHALEFGIGIRRGAFGVQVMDMYILQLMVAATVAHGLDQALRRTGHAAQMDMVSRFDHPDRLGSRYIFNLFLHGGYFELDLTILKRKCKFKHFSHPKPIFRQIIVGSGIFIPLHTGWHTQIRMPSDSGAFRPCPVNTG